MNITGVAFCLLIRELLTSWKRPSSELNVVNMQVSLDASGATPATELGPLNDAEGKALKVNASSFSSGKRKGFNICQQGVAGRLGRDASDGAGTAQWRRGQVAGGRCIITKIAFSLSGTAVIQTRQQGATGRNARDGDAAAERCRGQDMEVTAFLPVTCRFCCSRCLPAPNQATHGGVRIKCLGLPVGRPPCGIWLRD